MYFSIKLVCWVDNSFTIYTTIVIGGLFWTFPGEIDDEKIEAILSMIIDRLEHWEEDGATNEMSANVSNILYEKELETNFILN